MLPESHAMPLSQWYVISLRPQNLHAGVRRAAAALGARTFALSPLRLRMLNAKKNLPEALDCARIVVTSPAAVRMAQAQQSLQAGRGRLWFAIGAGSAAALHRCGIEHVHLPENGADSAALLAHPDLQDIHGQRIGLVTAPGGRGLLATTLRERGAEVVTAHVYRREAVTLAKARLAALRALPSTSALMVSSGEALAALWRQLDSNQQAQLRQRLVVASSERLTLMLQQQGFENIVRSRDAGPKNLLAALAAHVSAGHIR